MQPSAKEVLAGSIHRGTEVSATRSELWWSVEGEWQSCPWWQVEQATWSSEDEMLWVAPVGQEPFRLAVSPETQVAEVVRERVMSTLIIEATLEVGSGVHVAFRRAPDGIRVQTRWAAPLEEQIPALRSAASGEIRMLAAQLGVEIEGATI